jgi:NAD(P)H dehydrogenase (quinone)
MKLALWLLAAGVSAQQGPVRILVAYHSETGQTAKLAEAVRKGAAAVGGVAVTLKKDVDVTDAGIAGYDGVAFGAPVHWGTLAADGKRFLDRMANAFAKEERNGDGRAAGVFCTAGAVSSGKDLARLAAIAELLSMRFTVVGGVDAEGYGTLGPQATTARGAAGVDAIAQEEGRAFGERLARTAKALRSASVKP